MGETRDWSWGSREGRNWQDEPWLSVLQEMGTESQQDRVPRSEGSAELKAFLSKFRLFTPQMTSTAWAESGFGQEHRGASRLPTGAQGPKALGPSSAMDPGTSVGS